MPTSIRRSVGSLLWSLGALVGFPALSSDAGGQVPPARDGQPELIPRDLVVALLTFGSGVGGSDLKVGKVPDDTPPEFVPPGAEVLGSMTQFENVVVVLGVRETPDSAVGVMQTRLLASGWTRPVMPAPGAPPRGFVAADFATGSGMNGMPDVLCRGDESVTLSSMYRSSGGSLLKVSFNRGARYSSCRRREEVAMHRSPYEEAPIPVLRAPPGSMMSGGSGSSASNNQVRVSTRLSTRLSPGEVIAHYDPQMRAAGWAPVGNGVLDFLAARTYQKTDDKTTSWTAVLYSIKSPDARDQDVALTLSRR